MELINYLALNIVIISVQYTYANTSGFHFETLVWSTGPIWISQLWQDSYVLFL